MCVCVCVCVCITPVFFAEIRGEEVEPMPSGELDLSGIDDDEIDKVSYPDMHVCVDCSSVLVYCH